MLGQQTFFFSETAHKIFLKFYMKLEGLKGQELKNCQFWEKKTKIPLK